VLQDSLISLKFAFIIIKRRLAMRFEHPRLLVSNFAACFIFYRDVIGLKVSWGSEDDSYASFTEPEDDDIVLALFKRVGMADVVGTADLPPEAECQDRVALIVSVEDVDATFMDLTSQGIEFIVSPQDFPDWGIRSTYLRDPDGNLIELYTGLERSEWSEGLKEASQKFEEE
jgi:catechol 2,3-dioxygenase-like lactoylglutathione lyase family enzyme